MKESFLTNPKLDKYLLESPGLCEDLFVANRTAFFTLNLTPALFQIAAVSKNVDLRKAISINKNIPIETLVLLSEDRDDSIRAEVAKNERIPVSVLKKLLNDRDTFVRIDAILNPFAPKWSSLKLIFHQKDRSAEESLTLRFAAFTSFFSPLIRRKFFLKNIHKLLTVQRKVREIREIIKPDSLPKNPYNRAISRNNCQSCTRYYGRFDGKIYFHCTEYPSSPPISNCSDFTSSTPVSIVVSTSTRSSIPIKTFSAIAIAISLGNLIVLLLMIVKAFGWPAPIEIVDFSQSCYAKGCGALSIIREVFSITNKITLALIHFLLNATFSWIGCYILYANSWAVETRPFLLFGKLAVFIISAEAIDLLFNSIASFFL